MPHVSAPALTTLLAALLLAGCAPDWRAQLAAWKHPDALPAFPLVDDTGRAFSLADLKGEPLFVAFVFSRCPVADACPMTMARLKEVERVAPSRRILVVTLNPAFDTPPVLAAFKQKHGVNFTMATGAPEVIEALTSLFNVVALQRGAVASSPNLAHPVKLALLDKDLRPVHEWTDNNFDPREIVNVAVESHAPAAQ